MPKIPQMPKIRKVKRVSVLTKRSQCLGKHYKERSYRPLYEKLKSNNSFLAKALSKEKQNSQSLFTQNVQLIAENQQLNLVCNTQNTVIANVVNNSKEILKMLITLTGYITSTLSMCQELTASTTTRRISSIPDERKEPSNRLSTKSPTKGVVKPMVGGHTITKPTINLSRVNMETISRLSDIQEVTTPNSSEISENRSSITVSLPSTPLRYENNRNSCRMPERLTISSPRINDTSLTSADEERLRRRRRNHSKRISGSYSRSRSRWSDEAPTTSTNYINVASPTIQLKDISNLLRNSQTINIRRIIENRIDDIENQENNDNAPGPSERNVIISETHMSNSNEENKTHAQTSKKDSNIQISSKDKGLNKNPNVMENSRLSQTNTRNWEEEDPLEGPSWLFNNTIPSRDTEPEELNHSHDLSDVNNNTSQLIYDDDESSSAESNTEELSLQQNLNEPVSDVQILDTDSTPVTDHCESYSHENNENDDNFCQLLSANVVSRKENLYNIEDSDSGEDTINFARFVTLRRGEHPEETEDFTLMLSRQPMRNMQFNINELRLPNLEETTMNINGIDTDATARSSIANNSILSASNQTLNESERDETAMRNLPLSSVEDNETESTSQKKNLNRKAKKDVNKIAKTLNSENEINHIKNNSKIENKTKRKDKSRNNKDPSKAKVVLEKLNEYHVKSRTPLADDIESRNSHDHMKETMSNSELDETGDSESNMNTNYASGRLRRRKAPVNLKEPTLQKKLRRN
ncbi:probable serine/threonine-protein kinase clkA [Nylanderia fulva]|uniref:probable serine/threonine-protein kinase clkA n=1 Tax=Nylanderia fulva TaxID=613905 RepID=UPI0010FAECBE|nr:probable serine/threonine-protein kinase clkA [Nylanderia fulva]XP_029172746.1 probable serine/threonine-protein kinase clkA [Nylanderia fulva]XP_029172747.1 probable serine/threonine-protein kinase clkA [Nylanderia fulva]